MRSLKEPPDRHRLDLLLRPDIDAKTGKSRHGFETVQQSRAEDRLRAVGLAETARTLMPDRYQPARAHKVAELQRLKLDGHAAADLASRLQAGAEDGTPEPTPASSSFMRELRVRILGSLLELIDKKQRLRIETFNAIHPSCCFPAHRMMDVDARQKKNQFRTQLIRAGVTNAPGFLFGSLHGEFEPSSREFQLHFHGVCAGEKVKAFQNLRNKQGYLRTENIFRPIVTTELKDIPRQISYCLQSFWPEKFRTPNGPRVRRKRRIRQPYESLYLLWLDKWKLSDILVLNGIRFKDGRLELN